MRRKIEKRDHELDMDEKDNANEPEAMQEENRETVRENHVDPKAAQTIKDAQIVHPKVERDGIDKSRREECTGVSEKAVVMEVEDGTYLDREMGLAEEKGTKRRGGDLK